MLGEGFLQKGNVIFLNIAVHDGVRVVAGHVETPQRGSSCREMSEEFTTVHLRHDQVGQQQVDPAFKLLEELHRPFRRRAGDHVVAQSLEQASSQAQKRGLIFDQ